MGKKYIAIQFKNIIYILSWWYYLFYYKPFKIWGRFIYKNI